MNIVKINELSNEIIRSNSKNDNDNDNDYLFIVEHSAKIIILEQSFGKNYQIISTNGNLCKIDGIKNINIKNNFQPMYSIIHPNINILQSIIKSYQINNILLATNNDIEGEKIAFDICRLFHLPLTTKRILFNEITKNAIQYALKNPTIINIHHIKSHKSRQIIDILIIYKINSLLWKDRNMRLVFHENAYKNTEGNPCIFAVCRCLSLLNKIEKENINNYKYYQIIGSFFEFPYTTSFTLSHHFDNIEDIRSFLIQSKTYPHLLTIDTKQLIINNPPLPFNTVELLQASSFSSKITMKLAHQLYLQGYITYNQTESTK